MEKGYGTRTWVSRSPVCGVARAARLLTAGVLAVRAHTRRAVLHRPAMPEIRGSVLVFCIVSRTSITGSGCGRLNWLPMPADKRGRKSIGEGNVIEGSGDHVRPREVEILGEGMWRRHHEQPGTCCSSNPMRRVFDGN